MVDARRDDIWEHVRDLLTGLGAVVSWIATGVTWGTRHGLFLSTVYASAFTVMVAWRAIQAAWPLTAFRQRLPRAGKRGRPDLLACLRSVYSEIGARDENEFRITLFLPDRTLKTLVQMSRLMWREPHTVSRTKIRVGTCAVGHAFNTGRAWYVPAISKFGSFIEALVWCGLTEQEARGQILQARGCFAAIPLFAQDATTGKEHVIGVLAIDARTECAMPNNLIEIVTRQEPVIVGTLFDPKKFRPVGTKRQPELLEDVSRMSENLLPSRPAHPRLPVADSSSEAT